VFEYGDTTQDDNTGFGLDIVESLATAHGWTVEVEPSRDGGTRFVFEGVAVSGQETLSATADSAQ